MPTVQESVFRSLEQYPHPLAMTGFGGLAPIRHNGIVGQERAEVVFLMMVGYLVKTHNIEAVVRDSLHHKWFAHRPVFVAHITLGGNTDVVGADYVRSGVDCKSQRREHNQNNTSFH